MPEKRKAEEILEPTREVSTHKQPPNQAVSESSLHLVTGEIVADNMKQRLLSGDWFRCSLCRNIREDLGVNKERDDKPKESNARKPKDADAIRALIHALSCRKQIRASRILRPAGLINKRFACFANTGVQALHCIDELRIQLSMKVQVVVNELKSNIEHQRTSTTKGRSLTTCLGRAFLSMNAAAQSGKSASLYDGFLETFGTLHREYDGKKQQETFDFIDKTLQRLMKEEIEVSGEGSIPLVTRLFGGQTMNRLKCSACGRLNAPQPTSTLSLQLKIPKRRRIVPLEDCLKRYFEPELLEDYPCPDCERANTTSMQEVIDGWSPYLVLNCDRAGYDDMGPNKKTMTPIRIPSDIILDKHMAGYREPTTTGENASSGCSPSLKYEVVAFVHHEGKRNDDGHYVIVRKMGSQWFLCDDKVVKLVDRDKAFAATVCTVIILKRSSSGNTLGSNLD
ncbi:MAG: hypothetical protein Q9220_001462 [cf. Caloplaca sp. 1 TL-2023]